MRFASIISRPSTSDGTFGELIIDDGTVLKCGELPWHNNAGGISCIPATEKGKPYLCKWFNSPKHGWCYQVYGVPNRSMIEIHSANFMGDAALGKVSQLLGCIALGKKLGGLETFQGSGKYQMAVLQSKGAIAEFEDNMKHEDFFLTVIRG
jgi:hypothetical protein